MSATNISYRDIVLAKQLANAEGVMRAPFALDNAAYLDPFQKAIVLWALRKGKAAIFADCGLGKTRMQLEWAAQICKASPGGKALILAPLAVTDQTAKEGDSIEIPVNVCDRQEDVIVGINITNYESLHKFVPDEFIAVVLDESSILKSYMGKVKQNILNVFFDTQYKLACTATPAPNDHLELGNHAQFLNVMNSNEMIARWFLNDTKHTGNYRLKQHATESFWEWVGTWAVCLGKPSDIGDYDDSKFRLPALKINEIVIDVDQTEKAPPGRMFRTVDMSATSIHTELRLTAEARAKKAAEIVNAKDDYFIVWCNTNYEADLLKKYILRAVEVRGSEPSDIKKRKLAEYGDAKHKIIITKPSIAGFGLNWQHCNNVVFVGLSYSFENLYQALRRSYRFGQTETVNAYVISASTELDIRESIWRKMNQHDIMRENMVMSTKSFGNEDAKKALTGFTHKTVTGDRWEMRLGDCVEVMNGMKDSTVDFSIFSPPFANLYIYSDSMYDMGNCSGDAEFFNQFGFAAKELYRLMRPGRLCAVHCKDLVDYRGRDGRAGLRDFPGKIISTFEEHGWKYHSRVTIWKDPVVEMQRTKAHGLLHRQVCADSTFSRQGLPDYLLIFRKWEESENIIPVNGGDAAHRFESYIGENAPRSIEAGNDKRTHSIDVWQRYASPVWFDINQMNVLNIVAGRESRDEKHICPLQLDVIKRAVHLWSNPGDTVFSPFAGIGSEGVPSLEMGRKFIGVELKESYFDAACKHLYAATMQPKLI